MADLRKQTRNRDCAIRLPNCCNFNPETTVLAHLRLIGISGFGIKSPDVLGAWACSACHTRVDSDHSPEVQLAFHEGIFRTQAELHRLGILRW